MGIFTLGLEHKHIFDQVLIGCVWRPFVREDPCDACLAGSVDELHCGFFWSESTQRDDQCILASECIHECLLLVIVDLLGDHTFGYLGLAFDSGDCCDRVLSSFEQGFGYEPANITASLHMSVYNLLR